MSKSGHKQPLFDNKPELTLFSGDQPVGPRLKEDSSPFAAPEIRGPDEKQLALMESYSGQMSGIQVAKAAGVKGYIPSAPPDVAVEPERAKKIIIDRRKLGRLGKLAADQPPIRIVEELRGE